MTERGDFAITVYGFAVPGVIPQILNLDGFARSQEAAGSVIPAKAGHASEASALIQ